MTDTEEYEEEYDLDPDDFEPADEDEDLEDDEAGTASPSSGNSAFDKLTHKLGPEAKLAMREAIDELNIPKDDVLLILMERMGIFLDLYEKIPGKIQAATAQAVEDAQIPIVKYKKEAIGEFFETTTMMRDDFKDQLEDESIRQSNRLEKIIAKAGEDITAAAEQQLIENKADAKQIITNLEADSKEILAKIAKKSNDEIEKLGREKGVKLLAGVIPHVIFFIVLVGGMIGAALFTLFNPELVSDYLSFLL